MAIRKHQTPDVPNGPGRPALRLFDPEPLDLPTSEGGGRVGGLALPTSDYRSPLSAPPAGLGPALRLSEFFERHVLAILTAEDAAPRNIAQYRESVRLWAAVTGDPALGAIDQRTCDEFLAVIRLRTNRRGEPISPNTVLKHRMPVQRILDLAGPRTRQNPRAAAPRGLLGLDEEGRPREAPMITRPRPRLRAAEGGWTLAEIGLWLEAAERLEGPPIGGLPPAVFWRWLVVLLYNTALRIGTALRIRRDMIDGGWLRVPAEAMKGRRRELRLWLNRHAREAVDRLTTADARVVPWPYLPESIKPHVRRLRIAAGISEARARAIDKPLHGMRARCLTILWGRNPGVAKMVAGHTGGDVTLSHYVGASAMRGELDRLPQPKTRKPAGAKDQRLLFEDL